MALIKCPECGRDVSDTCAACIHCGYSLHKRAPEPQPATNIYAPPIQAGMPVQKNFWEKNKILFIILSAALATLLVVGIFFFVASPARDPFEKLEPYQTRQSVRAELGEPDFNDEDCDTYEDYYFLNEKGTLRVFYNENKQLLDFAAFRYELSSSDPSSKEIADGEAYKREVINYYNNKYGKYENSDSAYYDYEWTTPEGISIRMDASYSVKGTVFVLFYN